MQNSQSMPIGDILDQEPTEDRTMSIMGYFSETIHSDDYAMDIITAILGKLNEVQKSNLVLCEQLESEKSNLDILDGNLKANMAESDKLRKQLQAAEEELSATVEKLSATVEELSATKKYYSDAYETGMEWYEAHNSITQKYNATVEELTELQEDYEILNQVSDECVVKVEELTLENNVLTQKLAEMKAQNDELNTMLSSQKVKDTSSTYGVIAPSSSHSRPTQNETKPAPHKRDIASQSLTKRSVPAERIEVDDVHYYNISNDDSETDTLYTSKPKPQMSRATERLRETERSRATERPRATERSRAATTLSCELDLKVYIKHLIDADPDKKAIYKKINTRGDAFMHLKNLQGGRLFDIV